MNPTLTHDDLVELDPALQPVAAVLDSKLTKFEALMVAHALKMAHVLRFPKVSKKM